MGVKNVTKGGTDKAILGVGNAIQFLNTTHVKIQKKTHTTSIEESEYGLA